MKENTIFGPVPSRRLGISLGIDPVQYKTCSFNCVYCECGRTTKLTAKREPYVSAEYVLRQLHDFLQKYNGPEIEFVTFSGSGEPTLNSEIGIMVDEIKKRYNYKVAVITNSSLLWDEQVRKDLYNADVVLPSLDAVDDYLYKKINRPSRSIKMNQVIEGLIKFREEFKGEIWLEILFIKGLNDSDEHLFKLKDVVAQIKPERIQINTVDRPPPERWALPLNEEKLAYIQRFFGEKSEIIAPFKKENLDKIGVNNRELIIELLKRRPETVQDISDALGFHINDVNKELRILESEGKVNPREFNDRVFYYVVD